MTSPSHQLPAPAVLPEPEPLEPPFAPGLVQELLRLTSKAARAHQLYLPNNPVYQGAITTLRTGFRPLWEETDQLSLTFTENEIRWFDAVVSDSSGVAKSSDSLAWLFYKDGVRELTMLRGFEENEVVKFLEIILRARKGGADEDDLVTMLWESDFLFLQYKYVDLLSDGSGGDDLADGGEQSPPPAADAVRQSTREAVEESRAGGLVNMADFDGTLYFLDQREIEYLESELAREYSQDLRTNVVSVLLDIFESQPDPEIRAEVLDNIQTLLVYLLAAGHFRGVAYALREVQSAVQRVGPITPEQRDKLASLPERLSAPETLGQLLQALDTAPSLPPNEELIELFDQLRPAALETVFLWLAKLQNDRLRPLLETAAGRLAAANTAELVRLIQVGEPDVSSEAIRRAGALKAQVAVLAIGRVLGESDVARRQLAVQALTEIASPGALQALEKAVEDDDRDVRVTAIRALTLRGYRPVLPRLESVVKGKAVRDADLTEKMAFFEAYGSLCGDGGVAYLDSVLNGKSLLGRREDSEIRACAAIALGRVNSPKAQEALRKASVEKDVVVRNAVNRALRGPT
ncbi:MAG TPA: HEAT repeat domain-containing protein [Gemmatimonadaceae bacterium]